MQHSKFKWRSAFICAVMVSGTLGAQQATSDDAPHPALRISATYPGSIAPIAPLTAFPSGTDESVPRREIIPQAPDSAATAVEATTAEPIRVQDPEPIRVQDPVVRVEVTQREPEKVPESPAARPLPPSSGASSDVAESSSDASAIPTAAGGFRMGSVTAFPAVTYELQHNDNILLQAPGTQTKSDLIQVLRPSLRAEAKQGPNAYAVNLGANFGRYRSSKADDYENYNLGGSAFLNPTARVRMNLRADYLVLSDPRGSTNDPLSATPNRYHQEDVGGIFSYGAPGAQGRIDLEVGGMAKRYINNRATTAINDRSENNLGGTFYWRIAPKTSLLAQIRRTGIDFTDPASPLDSTEMRYLGGVTWEATAKTTGTIKFGQVKKDFKDPTQQGLSSATWDAQVQWTPLTYSRWDFSTSKTTRETTGNVGSFILSTTYAVTWSHAWTNRFSTVASGSYLIDDYQGIDRNDKTGTLGLRGSYQMRRWLSFGAGYERSARDSNVDTVDYRRNIFTLFVSGTL